MSRYHCCFLGDDNRVTDFQLFKASTDEDAVRCASELLQTRPETFAAEIWQAGRFIVRVSALKGYALVH